VCGCVCGNVLEDDTVLQNDFPTCICEAALPQSERPRTRIRNVMSAGYFCSYGDGGVLWGEILLAQFTMHGIQWTHSNLRSHKTQPPKSTLLGVEQYCGA